MPRMLSSARLFSPMVLSIPSVALMRQPRKVENGSTRTWCQKAENHKVNTATFTPSHFLSLRHLTASSQASQASQGSREAIPASPTATPAVSHQVIVLTRKTLTGTTGAQAAPTRRLGVTGMAEAAVLVRPASSQRLSRQALPAVPQLRMDHLDQPYSHRAPQLAATGVPPPRLNQLIVVHHSQSPVQALQLRPLVASLATTIRHAQAALPRTQASRLAPVDQVVSRLFLHLYTVL